jgi:hypothetical protein
VRSSDFMRAVPAAVRAKLPEELRDFKPSLRAWLVQLAYGTDPRIHYEVWLLQPRFRQGPSSRLIEIGLHCESRDAAVNQALLDCCWRHLFEIKEALGPQVEAEPWDKGWTKCYEVVPLEGFNEEFLDLVAGRLARYIEVLQPLVAPEEPAAAPRKAGARKRRTD